MAECGSVKGLLAALVMTGTAANPSPDEQAAYYAAIDSVAPDRWGETVLTPLGPMMVLGAARFAAQHMMYHDGQINYLHMLHGDTEMHWK